MVSTIWPDNNKDWILECKIKNMDETRNIKVSIIAKILLAQSNIPC